jgi:DNA-binding transcriptional regulator YiaG
MKDERIVTPTMEELQALFNLPSDSAPAPRQSADSEVETLSDPEEWVKDFLSDLDSPHVDLWDYQLGRPKTECMLEGDKAEKQREMLTAALPTAIRALRKKLGKSQWDMVRKLGLRSTSCYSNWEHGRTVPSGDAILLMLRLCPDAETLANFGLSFPSAK